MAVVPTRAEPICLWVAAFHSWIVLSPPVPTQHPSKPLLIAKVLPSGLNATEATEPTSMSISAPICR